MSGFNLEAQWVKFTERWPEAEGTVMARNFESDNVVATCAADDSIGEVENGLLAAVVFNGEYYMRKSSLRNWEWLEVREKGGE